MAKKAKTMKGPTPEPKQEVPSEIVDSVQPGKSNTVSLLSRIGTKFPGEPTGKTLKIEYEYQPEPPKPREFEARPCTSCQALRPHGTSYSRVYCTRGRIRYCKCHYCGHTWSQEGK